jgi:transketolase
MDSKIKAAFDRRMSGEIPGDFDSSIDAYKKKLAEEQPNMATRKSSEAALTVINGVIPETVGGSADLTGSNNTKTEQTAEITPDDFSGRYIHYGVREHGMAAAMNGMALHGGLIPYSGGFLVFSDYCRPAIRLAALMGIRVIHVLTHDSIGLGEDGPTHQPVEHLASLRAIPNLLTFRPADATEVAECWQLALESDNRPSAIALTRQNLPSVRTDYVEENLCAYGAYDLVSASDADITIFASGSEVEIALQVRDMLDEAGRSARVVSVPCFELFEEQSQEYQEAIIGNSPIKVAIEAAIRQGWDRFIGNDGLFIGMKGFGASAPYQDLYGHFGITAKAAFETIEATVESLTGESE